jgi:perosamine synthetase
MDLIPVNEPQLSGGNEKKYLTQCIDSGWISSEGPFVAEFEDKFSARMRRRYGIAVSNGTAALDIAVEAMGIKAGDEVIVPSFTIISCILQIVRIGAVPIFVDSDLSTWNQDVASVEAKITPRTKAIMAVHIYGLPVNLNPLLELCEKYNLILIEDSAETIGQNYFGQPCGSFGDISTVSFYPNKHITTGEGGMILTDDERVANRCRELRNLCFDSKKRFLHRSLGWNYRMTNMQAAIGLAQLERLDHFLHKKVFIGECYTHHLAGLDGLILPLPETEYAKNIYWVFGIILKPELGLKPDVFRSQLLELGVASRPFFFPLHRQPVLREYPWFRDRNLPNADFLSDHGLYLPSGLGISESQIIETCKKVKVILDGVK